MSESLTIHSFLLGTRTETAKYIHNNPFYNGTIDRATAERLIPLTRLPILRKSSMTGLYAITFICPVRRTIIHSLLHQKPDLSVDIVDLTRREASESFADVYDLLNTLISRSATLPLPTPPTPPTSCTPSTSSPCGLSTAASYIEGIATR